MSELLIRDLDPAVISGLNQRAAENHTSPEEEARRVLADNVKVDREAWRARARVLADKIGPLPGPTSTEILRAMRYGDDEV